MQTINVRVIQNGGRLRIRETSTGLYVSCDQSARQSMPIGKPLTILASMRADGKCWIAATMKGSPIVAPAPVQPMAT